MVDYKCLRCGYTTHIKTIFVRHLNRKTVCQPILEDINVEQIIEHYFNDIKITETKIIETKTEINVHNCIYCNKHFTSYSSKWRHEKKYCKKIHKEDQSNMLQLVKLLNEQLKDTKKELNKRDKQIDALIKKTGFNINNNIQNNINLLGYLNTDISHLTDHDYLSCLNHKNYFIPYLIKKIHFNPAKPENHNIYISNIKNNYVMLYDGTKWNLQNRNEAITELIDDKEFIMEQKLEEWIENGKHYPDIMTKFNNYLEKKENDELVNSIKEEIKLLLFNNRNLLTIKL